MSEPWHPVPDEQIKAFRLAVCERLGVDPGRISEQGFSVEIIGEDELGRVSLTAFLPADELLAMFNAAGSP